MRNTGRRIFLRFMVFILSILITLVHMPEKRVSAGVGYAAFLQEVFYYDEGITWNEIPIYCYRESGFYIRAYYRVTPVNATVLHDYYLIDGYIDIEGTGIVGKRLLIYDDSIVEGDEEFLIEFYDGDYLDDPENGYYASCRVIIVDNDGAAPPECVQTSNNMTPAASSVSSESIVFEITQEVEINDSSGSGWNLDILLDEFIELESNTVDDPCIPGGSNFISVRIPADSCVQDICKTCTVFPDGSSDVSVVHADITGMITSESKIRVGVASDDSGMSGIYSVTLKLTVNIPIWLPAGSIITPGGSLSRFDGDDTDGSLNDYVVVPEDKIQIFSGNYLWNTVYEVYGSAP